MCWGRILFERRGRSNDMTSPFRVIGESVTLSIASGARIQQITELIATCTELAIKEREYRYQWRGRAPRSPRMTQRRADDPAQADRAWFGYHPRAALPALVVAAAVTLVVWTGRWYHSDLRGQVE